MMKSSFSTMASMVSCSNAAIAMMMRLKSMGITQSRSQNKRRFQISTKNKRETTSCSNYSISIKTIQIHSFESIDGTFISWNHLTFR